MATPLLTPLTQLPLQWDLFHTQADLHLAQLYGRLHTNVDLQPYWQAGWRIEGELYGPHCSRSHTLPAHYLLDDQGSGATLLAQGYLPDPCFWSAEIPALYQATLKLTENGQVRQQQQMIFGLRSLAVQGQQLLLNREPWILKAAPVDKLSSWSVEECREQSLALIVDQVDDSLLRQASELGLWVIANLQGNELEICEQLSNLACWPAVCMGIVQEPIANPEPLRRIAPNLILGQWIRQPSELPPADWSQLLFCEFRTPEEFSRYSEGCSLPVVAVRSVDATCSVDETIEACRILENDLATAEKPAGYAMI